MNTLKAQVEEIIRLEILLICRKNEEIHISALIL